MSKPDRPHEPTPGAPGWPHGHPWRHLDEWDQGAANRSRVPLGRPEPTPRTVRPSRYLVGLGAAMFVTLGAAILLGGWYGLGLWAGFWLLAGVAVMLWLAMAAAPKL